MSSSVEPLAVLEPELKNAAIAEKDVAAVCATFSDLRSKVDTFFFTDGTRKKLLRLEGTIPVNYRGATYNIPVEIWLMPKHPFCPPTVYVKPTSTMRISSASFIDSSGKVDLPYLQEWNHPKSDLLGLIQIMTIVFGEQPPVYSKSPGPKELDTSSTCSSSCGVNKKCSNKHSVDLKRTPSDEDLVGKCDTCRADDTLREAEAFCANCKEYFCRECLNYHGRMTATRNHKIFRKE